MLVNNLLLIILFYLIGSLPFALILTKLSGFGDIRNFGSGNVGATNVLRTGNKLLAIIVLFLDILKGWIAVRLVFLIPNFSLLSPELYVENQLAFGISAVIGHLFPIFTGFRGGKGIATMLGVLIGVSPLAALFSLCVFIFVLFASKYVSLASMIASITFPFFVMLILHSSNDSLNLFAIFVPMLSLITHQKNIERLLRGEETKVKFGKKSKYE